MSKLSSLRAAAKERREGVYQYAVRTVARVLKDADATARPTPTVDRRIATLRPIVDDITKGMEVMVRFTGSELNLYQIRAWLRPLEALNKQHPVLIATQSTATFQALTSETACRVVNAPTVSELEILVGSGDFKVCFYVNHVSSNFTAMRFADMFHVNIGHGESDKIYMASNQAKAYDYLFVAGQAAVDRYARNLIRFSTDKLIPIGRPQLDFAEPALETSKRITVLYAPTWEGDRPSMRYSSVPTYGLEALEALLSEPDTFRVIFRPHPFTGTRMPDAADRLSAITELMNEAKRNDPDAGHTINTTDDFVAVAASADVLISDNSAVVIDFLGMGKPFFVTRPESPESPLPTGGAWQVGYPLDRERIASLAEAVKEAAGTDPLATERNELARYYFGELARGASTQSFISATARLIEERDQLVQAKLDTLAELGLAGQ